MVVFELFAMIIISLQPLKAVFASLNFFLCLTITNWVIGIFIAAIFQVDTMMCGIARVEYDYIGLGSTAVSAIIARFIMRLVLFY